MKEGDYFEGREVMQELVKRFGIPHKLKDETTHLQNVTLELSAEGDLPVLHCEYVIAKLEKDTRKTKKIGKQATKFTFKGSSLDVDRFSAQCLKFGLNTDGRGKFRIHYGSPTDPYATEHIVELWDLNQKDMLFIEDLALFIKDRK